MKEAVAKNKNENYVWSSHTLPYLVPLLLGVVFAYLTLKVPTSTGRSVWVQLTIVIPEIIVWIIASIGAFRFKKYAVSIKEHRDGKALNSIANALLLLVLYIILLTTASSIVSLFANTSYILPAVAIKNHLPVIVILASVAYLLKGSVELNKIVSKSTWSRAHLLLLAGVSFMFFIVFAYAFYTAQPNSVSAAGIPRFALPTHVLLITYILPHVIVWFMGLKACINLNNYASRVSGSLYKSLFKDLYRGILLAFICIFIAQFMIISSAAITGLNFFLLLIYAVLVLATVGFVLILRGARKLDKVEKV